MRRMTTRDIQAQLQDFYGAEVSPALVSQVTNAVHEERLNCCANTQFGSRVLNCIL
ncbi:MAG: transposase [Cyanophyceae cyanobacterium]